MAALGLGACFYKPGIPKRVWVIGVVCSAIPDFDVIGFRFGIRYGDFWGHRGFTHSLVFAAVLAGSPPPLPESQCFDRFLRSTGARSTERYLMGWKVPIRFHP